MYLVRFAEVGRDGQAGRQGHRRDLAAEVAARLPGARIESCRGRLFVDSDSPHALAELTALPGVSSVSPCRVAGPGELETAAIAAAREALPGGGRFAVRVRVVGRGQSARALAARLGQAIAASAPDLAVDLRAPEATVGVELRPPRGYVYSAVLPGADRRGPAPARPDGPPRFLVDQMLGKLARWLRVLGFDAACDLDRPDSWLLRRARDEGRVLLTRDRALAAASSAASYLVEAARPDEQLAEVIRALDLPVDRGRLLTRCTACNVPVEPMPAALAHPQVPPQVRERHDRFFTCPSCRRIYWEGDHCARIAEHLDRLLPTRS